MHNKATFYPRLAAGNLIRNKSTYLPYLLACAVSILALYTLLAINLNGSLDNLPSAGSVKFFTAFGAVILSIFCAILLFYTNSFLIKRRKKELGLYSVLGMSKGNIGQVMFFESLFIGIISLAAGLAAGALLGKLVFMLLIRLIGFPVDMEMPLSPLAMGITTLFFVGVFLLILLTNLIQVRRLDPVTLMSGAKEGEREPKVSWVLTILGLLALGGGYYIALAFRNPMDTLNLFFVAVFLVIIGTYFLFITGSIALLKLLRKNKRYYYNPKHFIPVSGMLYRMKQNAAGLASICILSTVVLFTVSFSASLQIGGEDSVQTRYPAEYDITLHVPTDGEALLAGAEEIARKNDLAVTNLQDTRTYNAFVNVNGNIFTSESDYTSVGQYAYVKYMPLEDYNAVEGQNVTLAPGEALYFPVGADLKPGDSLTVDGIPYSLRPIGTLMGRRAGEDEVTSMITLVVPDMAAFDAALAARPADVQAESPAETAIRRTLNFDVEGSEAGMAAFKTEYTEYVNNLITQGMIQYNTREQARADMYTVTGGFLFLGLYLGLIFLLAAALMIYYKQLSEGYDDRDRYEILQKVGMSEEEVRHTISGQIRAVFFLPLAAAIIHIAVAFWPASRLLMVFGLTNRWVLIFAFVVTILAYAAIYFFVYRRTAGTYFRIVKRPPATT